MNRFMAGTTRTLHSIDTLSPGTLLVERFRIKREVGSGGMGFVYEAMDEKLTGPSP